MTTFYENKQTPVTARTGTKLTTGPHLHNHIEVVYLVRGDVYAVSDNKKEKMKDGDVFIAFPNQVHCYPNDDCVGSLEHIIIIFSPFVCREFNDLFLRMTPVSSVIRAEDLDPEVPLLIRSICDTSAKDVPYKNAILRGYLISCLGRLFASMEFREEKQSDGYILKNILNYCNKHYKEPLSLDKVAAGLGIGKYNISRILSEKLNISFPDYINGLRINDATQRLSETPDTPITDIAYNCGFSSTRTFNRAFLKYTGMSPRDYREKNLYQKVSPLNFYITD